MDKRREVDEHASVVGTNEPTTKARYVQSMPDKDPLAIEGDNGGTPSKNRKVGVDLHANL